MISPRMRRSAAAPSAASRAGSRASSARGHLPPAPDGPVRAPAGVDGTVPGRPILAPSETTGWEVAMALKALRFVDLFLVALVLGLSFCHVMEIPGKLRLAGPEWLA